MTVEENWRNFHFERSNTDISKNVSRKALNCESRGEITLRIIQPKQMYKQIRQHLRCFFFIDMKIQVQFICEYTLNFSMFVKFTQAILLNRRLYTPFLQKCFAFDLEPKQQLTKELVVYLNIF